VCDYAVHYRDTSEVKLINPVNIIFKMLAPPWVVSSEEGWNKYLVKILTKVQ
jgi:hypothetical protein